MIFNPNLTYYIFINYVTSVTQKRLAVTIVFVLRLSVTQKSFATAILPSANFGRTGKLFCSCLIILYLGAV